MPPEAQWSTLTTKTPVGRMWLIAKGARLWGAALEPRWPQQAHRLLDMYGRQLLPQKQGESPLLLEAAQALDDYFGGALGALTRIPVVLEGTDFQRKVWRALRRIKPGRTLSYRALTAKIAHEGAFRAVGAANGANPGTVGAANGANPCALFVPCHRVISSNNSLQGYSAGLRAKAFLLNHEGVKNNGRRLTD